MTRQPKVRRSKFKVQRSAIRSNVNDGRTARRLVPPLLRWFRRNARDLPWRHARDPYAIWVSEIMLQQTQVKTVIPYWGRWMRALPTVQALARARPEKVLKLWEGLGYYTRARNLRRAAQIIVKQHGGHFPQNFNEVLALPGIGRYTAGAICSIAFNQPTPVLDGNVIRVLTRLFGIRQDPKQAKVNAHLWRLANALVQEAADRQMANGNRRSPNCSHLNQALMDLGAVICTPRQPDCPRCPLRSQCVARRQGCAGDLPNLGKRPAPIGRRFVAFVAEDRGRFLVRQRPAGVVNARLWEFPNVELNGESSDLKRVAREVFGVAPIHLEPVGTVKHSITRYRITLEAFRARARWRSAKTRPDERWLRWTELRPLAFTSAHRRILKAVETDVSSGR